jgi:hypothetical protein
MIDIVLTVLLIALILAVILRQIKSDGYLILPKIENGKFQLNALFYILIGVFAGIPIIQTVYSGVNPTDGLSLLVGFGIVFTSIYGTNGLIDYAVTESPLVENEETN